MHAPVFFCFFLNDSGDKQHGNLSLLRDTNLLIKRTVPVGQIQFLAVRSFSLEYQMYRHSSGLFAYAISYISLVPTERNRVNIMVTSQDKVTGSHFMRKKILLLCW